MPSVAPRRRFAAALSAIEPGFAELIDAARYAPDLESYERELFAVLDRELGFDVAFCVRGGLPGPVSPGFSATVRREAAGSWERFARELAPMYRVADAQGGVTVDVDFFGERRLERMAHYQELMRPHGGRSSLLGSLHGSATRGSQQQLIGKVMLGRTTPRVRACEQRKLQRVLPLLSLCELALKRMPAARTDATLPTAVLTVRERDVLGYLQLGYTNREIAAACGSSPRTVRNQLSAIFAKLGASTRAEAVALSLGHGRGSA